MIDVQEVLRDVPHFETFCSVEKLHEFAKRLRTDLRFEVNLAGSSSNGVPIYHIHCGSGSLKALFLGGPHAMEPIGSLTVFSLMSLLREGNRNLLDADVEWHIVPCIDPDGAILNEGWTQAPFTFENYMRHFFTQPRRHQVDFSFPITHKRLVFDQPSKESRVLQTVLDHVRPDFCFSLHNYGVMGGTFFVLSRDIGEEYYEQLRRLLQQHRITLRTSIPFAHREFQEGMRDLSMVTLRQVYDNLEQAGVPIPEELLSGNAGASSFEYLMDIKPNALVFVAEIPHGQHPSEASEKETGQNLRRLKLRVDADSKFLATVILEEWERVKGDVDATSPFYQKILTELVERKDRLHEGIFEWYMRPIQEILFNTADSKAATERDRVDVNVGRMLFLCNAYTFARLLKASKQTSAVQHAIRRLEQVFDEALDDMREQIDFAAFEVTDCDRLAKVQLGSGLIALNSVLETKVA